MLVNASHNASRFLPYQFLISNVPQQAHALSYPARNLASESPRSAEHGVQLHPIPAGHVAA
jgi:hypothetical protein